MTKGPETLTSERCPQRFLLRSMHALSSQSTAFPIYNRSQMSSEHLRFSMTKMTPRGKKGDQPYMCFPSYFKYWKTFGPDAKDWH